MDNDGTPLFVVNLPPVDRFEPSTVINKLEPNQRQINLFVIVLRTQGNPQKTRDGHEIHSFKVADQTGSVTLSVWNTTGHLISPGDILRLQNCITQVFKNELCVKPGRSTNEKRKSFIYTSIFSFSDGTIIKADIFSMDFKEEPDMSVLPLSTVEPVIKQPPRLMPS